MTPRWVHSVDTSRLPPSGTVTASGWIGTASGLYRGLFPTGCLELAQIRLWDDSRAVFVEHALVLVAEPHGLGL
jgi:hypothetical protein